MHVHNISDIIVICGSRAFCGNLFLLAVPISPVATFCGWRLGEGECSSQLQLYLCPAVDSPLSAALLSQKSILLSLAAQFVKITHSDWCHFEWGLVAAFTEE